MAAKPSDAKTTIDSLAELIKEKGRMELSKIALTLGVEQSVVENWAKVLEAGNMVKISYEVGKMYVEPLRITKEQETAAAAMIDVEKIKLENQIAQQKSSLDRYTAKLEAISLSVSSAESMFKQKFPEIELQLEGINKVYVALEGENQKLESIRKKADLTFEEINKKVSVISGKVEGADSKNLESARDEAQKVQDILRKASEMEDQLGLLWKSKDKALETLKKSIEDELKALDKDLGIAKKTVSQQLKKDESQMHHSLKIIREQAKVISDYSQQVKSFRREKESIRKTLNDTKESFNNEYSKISLKMDNEDTTLRKSIKEMLAELDSLKSNFGEVGNLYDTLKKSKDEMKEVQKRIESIRKETDELADKVKSIPNMKGTVETKAAAMQNAEQQLNTLTTGSAAVDTDMDKITKDLED